MKPVQFEQATRTLGYTVAGRKVPVVRDHRRGETVSCWKLNALERIFALFTGRVWLRVMSLAPPPSSMQVRSPFVAPSGAPGKREPISAKQLLRWVKRLGKAAVVAAALAAPAAALPTQVLHVATSPDGQWRVEVADFASTTKFELWATPTGGARRKIGTAAAHDYDVFEALISSDSRRVVYRYGRTATGESHLYSTPIDRLQGVRISPPPTDGGRVGHGIALTWGGLHVRYPYAEQQGGIENQRIVGVTGGRIFVPIFVDGFESGNQGAWK